MKIRKGFVSNSSSSSYIIALGEVVNEDALKLYLMNNHIDETDYEFVKVSDFVCECTDRARLYKNNSEILVDSFNGDEVHIDFDPSKKYFVYKGYFRLNEDGEDMDYDVDESDFESTVFDLINKSDLVTNFNYSYGAGRNG